MPGRGRFAAFPVGKLYDRNIAEDRVKQEDERLFEAVRNDDRQRLQAVIYAGADVNSPGNKWQETPLHWAAALDFTEIARMLIEKGAKVNARDEDRQTPLHGA